MSTETQPYANLYAKTLLDYVHESDVEKFKTDAKETQPGVFVRYREAGTVTIRMTINFNNETVTADAFLGSNFSTASHSFDEYEAPGEDAPTYVPVA